MNIQIARVALRTLVTKEVTRILRIWVQTLIPPVITMSLYFLIFGRLVGSRIGEVQGYSYMEFIVPGLILMSVITNSYSNVVSSFFGARFGKSIEELLVAPVPNSVIIMGYAAGGMVRGLLVGFLVACVSIFFSGVLIYNPFILIGTVFLTAAIFTQAGFLNALFARKFDDVSIVPTFILTPLTYLGGIFYSVQMLPEPFYTISLFNPILYMINACRYGFLGISDISVYLSFAGGVVFLIALFCTNMFIMNRGYGIRT
ncbi:MAG: ABC transporter permease [Leptospirales bacterium]|jgi:ABC-2 type transport system permease protein